MSSQNGFDYQLCTDGSLNSTSSPHVYSPLPSQPEGATRVTDSTVPPLPVLSFSVGDTIQSPKLELWNSSLIPPFLLLPHGQFTTKSFLSLLAKDFLKLFLPTHLFCIAMEFTIVYPKSFSYKTSECDLSPFTWEQHEKHLDTDAVITWMIFIQACIKIIST